MSRSKGSKNKPRGDIQQGDIQLPLPLEKKTHMSRLKHISKHLSNPSPDGLRPASGFPPISIATSQVKRKGFKSNPLVQRSTGPTTRPVKLNPLKSKVSTTRIPPHRQKDRQEVVENTMHVIGPINEHLPHYLPVFTSNLLISWDENNLKFICTNVENSGISGTGKSEMSALGDYILERARLMKGG